MRPDTRRETLHSNARQTLPKLSEFVKSLRDNIGLWEGVPTATDIPPERACIRFVAEFNELGAKQPEKLGPTSRDNFTSWWQGKTRPPRKQMVVIVEMLLGTDDLRKDRRKIFWDQWEAANPKAASRKAAAALAGLQIGNPEGAVGRAAQRPAQYVARPDGSEHKTTIVDIAVDFAKRGQNRPIEFDQESLQFDIPVAVKVNFNRHYLPGLTCNLFLREFRIKADPNNCLFVPDDIAKKTDDGNIEMERHGREWEFRPKDKARDAYLNGDAPIPEVLGYVRQTATAADAKLLPSVKLAGVCPGMEDIVVVWREPQQDQAHDAASNLSREQQLFIEQFLKKCIGETKEDESEFVWASIALMEGGS